MTLGFLFRCCTLAVCAAAVCLPVLAEPSGAVLDRMDSEKFEVRDKAYGELRAWAQANLKESPEQLHKAWKSSRRPEVKSRCYALMKEMAILRKFGKGRGFVGIRMQETTVKNPGGKGFLAGVQITLVMPNTPGEKAGLKLNDVILGVDKIDFGKAKAPNIQQQGGLGFQMRTGVVTRFGDYIQSKQPDETITLHLLRGAKKMDVEVTLMKRPESADVDAFGRNLFDRAGEQDAFFKTWLRQMGNR